MHIGAAGQNAAIQSLAVYFAPGDRNQAADTGDSLPCFDGLRHMDDEVGDVSQGHSLQYEGPVWPSRFRQSPQPRGSGPCWLRYVLMRRLLRLYSQETRRKFRPALGYGLAFVCAGLAVAVTGTMPNPLFPTPLFFAAIVVSTWYGGMFSGAVTVLLAVLFLEYYYVPPTTIAQPGKPRLVDLIAQAAYLLRKIEQDEAQVQEDGTESEDDEL